MLNALITASALTSIVLAALVGAIVYTLSTERKMTAAEFWSDYKAAVVQNLTTRRCPYPGCDMKARYRASASLREKKEIADYVSDHTRH